MNDKYHKKDDFIRYLTVAVLIMQGEIELLEYFDP